MIYLAGLNRLSRFGRRVDRSAPPRARLRLSQKAMASPYGVAGKRSATEVESTTPDTFRPGQSICEASALRGTCRSMMAYIHVSSCVTQRPVPVAATIVREIVIQTFFARSGSGPDAVAATEGLTMTADEAFEHLHVNKRAKVRAPSDPEAQDVPQAPGSVGEDKAFEHHHVNEKAKIPRAQLVIHGAKTLVGAVDGTHDELEDECTTDYSSATDLSNTPERLPGTSGMTLTAGSKNPNRLVRVNSPTASPGAGRACSDPG